jgi:hypothetical protein
MKRQSAISWDGRPDASQYKLHQSLWVWQFWLFQFRFSHRWRCCTKRRWIDRGKKCQDRGLNTGPPECVVLQSVALPAELPRHTINAVRRHVISVCKLTVEFAMWHCFTLMLTSWHKHCSSSHLASCKSKTKSMVAVPCPRPIPRSSPTVRLRLHAL